VETGDFDQKFSVLKQEWEQCDAGIRQYDTLVFGIRGWAIAVFAALLTASVTLKRPSLMLFAIAPTFLLWVVEAVNKHIQKTFILRVERIEKYLSSSDFEMDVEETKMSRFETPKISTDFAEYELKKPWSKVFAIFRSGLYFNVYIHYLSISILCVGCWGILKFTKITGSESGKTTKAKTTWIIQAPADYIV
jgi:hypothetical protein